MIVFIIF